MAIGTAAAIAIGAAASAAGQIASSKIASNASQRAARTQVTASNQALEYAKQAYAQAQQLQAPYLGIGNQSLSLLGRLTGNPQGMKVPVSSGAPPMAPPVQMPQYRPMSAFRMPQIPQ